MRLVLVTGPGGVGKTTVAAGTAALLAARGAKTLVLSTDTTGSLADVLGTPVPAQPAEVDLGLAAMQVDAQRRFDRAWPGLAGLLHAAGAVQPQAGELAVLPGATELLTLLDLRDQVASGRWDAVVADCGGPSDALRLLALPEVLGSWLERLYPMHERVLRVASARQDPTSGLSLLAAVDRLQADLADVLTMLGTSEVTTARLVVTPEPPVLAATRRLATGLALHAVPVDSVVANRVFRRGGRWPAAVVASHAHAVNALQAEFPEVPVRVAPYQADPPVGTEQLLDLGRVLYGDNDPAGGDPPSASPAVDRDGAEYILRLPLPFADRADVGLARAGDDLAVTVAGLRRLLPLPSGLRRCQALGAQLRDGELRVRFRPDPALWPRVAATPGETAQPRENLGSRENG